MHTLLYSFSDWMLANEKTLPKGDGLFSVLHIVLLVALLASTIAFYLFSKKYKKASLKITTVLCYIMIVSRLFRMILLWATHTNTFVEILPWHLCHVMAFVFPAFYLTKTKKFFLPILAVTFYGGLLTFIFGNYYAFKVFTFLDLESILLHFIMMFVSVSCIATGYFKVQLKELWQTLVVLVLLLAHATLGNLLCKGQNFLFLKENGLPFNLFPAHHIFTYFVLVAFLYFITYLPIILYLYKNKPEKFNTKDLLDDVLDDELEDYLTGI